MNTQANCRTTVLIVNYNSGDELVRTVGTVLNRVSPVELIIVDNASVDDSLEQVSAQYGGDLHIIRNHENIGFGPACNQGIQFCNTEFVLILNSDCELAEGAIRRCEEVMDLHPRAGLVSGVVVGEDGHEQRGSRRRLPTPSRVMAEMLKQRENGIDLRHLPMPETLQEVEAVSGACMFIRRSAFLSISGFDTGYTFHFEDLDLMRRLHDETWKIILIPELRIRHIGGLSSRARPLWVSRQKHRGLLRYLHKHCQQNPLGISAVYLLTWLHFVLISPLLLLGLRRP